MKTLIIIALNLITGAFIYGQSLNQNTPVKNGETEVTTPTYNDVKNIREANVEKSNSVICNYLCNNLKYPEDAINCCLQGTELVRFTVLQTGELANIKVLNSICPKIDEEVIRVLSNTNGMWTPGTSNGVPVKMEKEVLIAFHLEGFHFGTDDEYFKKKATNWYIRGNHALFEDKNPQKALKCYNNALRYQPLEHALLYARGMVKYELNDTEGAKNDWDRMKSLAVDGENENILTLIVDNY